MLRCFSLALRAAPLKGWGCFSCSCFSSTLCLLLPGESWAYPGWRFSGGCLCVVRYHRSFLFWFYCPSCSQSVPCAAVWVQSEGHRTGLDLLRRHQGKNLFSAELWQRMRRKSCRRLLEAAGQSEEICLERQSAWGILSKGPSLWDMFGCSHLWIHSPALVLILTHAGRFPPEFHLPALQRSLSGTTGRSHYWDLHREGSSTLVLIPSLETEALLCSNTATGIPSWSAWALCFVPHLPGLWTPLAHVQVSTVLHLSVPQPGTASKCFSLDCVVFLKLHLQLWGRECLDGKADFPLFWSKTKRTVSFDAFLSCSYPQWPHSWRRGECKEPSFLHLGWKVSTCLLTGSTSAFLADDAGILSLL